MRRAFGFALLFIGVVFIAATVIATVHGVRHPSSSFTVAIALIAAIAVPVGLTLMTAGWHLFQEPDAVELRTEAKAKLRAANALEEAETAEEIKKSLVAYVELRTRRMEVERKRVEVENSTRTLNRLFEDLKAEERRLGLEVTQIGPEVVGILDAYAEPKLPWYFNILRASNVILPAVQVDQLIEGLVHWTWSRQERSRLSKLSSLAAGELARDPDGNA